ncbi:MAG TPA: hypothetical protein VGP72_27005 [Planctomycetota bacterium]|jgi:hypothetical protein
MPKITAHFSRKVPAGDYASTQFSASLEVEVASEGDESLKAALRRLYVLVRQSVDEQLASGKTQLAQHPVQPDRNNGPQSSTPKPNGNGNGSARRIPATASQKKAILAIARAIGHDVAQYNVEQLTLQQASALIDQLKGQQASRR